MSFFFKGINSDEMSVVLEDEVFEAVPEMNVEDISIDGRNGDIYRELNYKDVSISKNAYLCDLRKADAVKRWLTGSGVLAYADRWKMAHIYGAIQFSRFGAFKYSFTLPLILSPFWLRVEDFIDMGQTSDTLTIENTGNINSQPYIRITQVTDTDLDITAGGVRFKLPGLGKGNTITINCEDRSEDKPRNISIGYDYPTFAPGYNIITVHTGTAGIEMRYKDRWI